MVYEWSGWQPLDRPALYNRLAVYKIRLIQHDLPASIPRFLGVDTAGMLSIGKTTNMETRRLQFIRGTEKGRGHSSGNLLHLLRQHSPLMITFPEHRYEYTFVQVKELGEETTLEEAEIKAYVRTFGEVPPLNSAIPDRYGEWGVKE
ncbi:MAG TPA: hypothetical protein VGD69_00805 [Herpetosiphonaceae bacterium]